MDIDCPQRWIVPCCVFILDDDQLADKYQVHLQFISFKYYTRPQEKCRKLTGAVSLTDFKATTETVPPGAEAIF